jgi:hypothetical protein
MTASIPVQRPVCTNHERINTHPPNPHNRVNNRQALMFDNDEHQGTVVFCCLKCACPHDLASLRAHVRVSQATGSDERGVEWIQVGRKVLIS